MIEVADTSLEKDRAKAAIYREAGVQEYWIINVADQCMERYGFMDTPLDTQPTRVAGDSPALLALQDKEIELPLERVFG